MSAHLEIKMVHTSGHQFAIDVDLSATVAELKEQIADQAGVPRENIRLVCVGRIWKDEMTVGSYEPRDAAIVHCLNQPARAAPASSGQTLSPVHPMQSMQPPAAAAGGDPFAQMMAQSQQMMAQNPELIRQLIDSPMVQQMMNDPETMRAMMRMNPRMEQLMEQRPEIARMLQDPELMRQSMQMMGNPSLMREAQRTSDLAMGHLDVMPGGHNALMRAHEEMVDPVMAALAGSDPNGAAGAVDLSAYTQRPQGGPNSEALPNPWGAPAPAILPDTGQTPAGVPTFQMPGQATAATGPSSHPMAAMMQQMMSNPGMQQQQQQSWMAEQLAMGGTGSQTSDMMGGAAPQAGTTSNPMAAAMQQMMSNPALMQQQMAQMLGAQPGGAGFPAMFGGQEDYEEEEEEEEEEDESTARARFASQLGQLSAMGFCNEAACLRALQLHQGRIDAAIDALLSSGDSLA